MASFPDPRHAVFQRQSKRRTEWEVHKLEQAETRDIDTVFLTCDEIVIEHLWETPDGQKHQWPNPKHQML